MLADKVRAGLSGPILNVKSGALRGAIEARTEATATGAVAEVGTFNDQPYAKIQEAGGKTPAHEIVAVKAAALAFFWQKIGAWALFAKVAHPGSNIPESKFLRQPLADMTPEIIAEYKAAVADAAGLFNALY
jgi:hypothetical protein